MPGGGDVESGDAKYGDGECRAVGAVDGIENATGDGGKDDEDDQQHDEPEAAGAADAAAAAAGLGLGTVREAGGAVDLGLGGREARAAAIEWLWRVRIGLGGRVDSIRHCSSISTLLVQGRVFDFLGRAKQEIYPSIYKGERKEATEGGEKNTPPDGEGYRTVNCSIFYLLKHDNRPIEIKRSSFESG